MGVLDRLFTTLLDRTNNAVHWFNGGTALAVWLPDWDVTLKIAAFLFVSLPLGIVQWWGLVDRWKERKAKHAAS